MNRTHKYDDIIDLPRPVSGKRSPMSNYDRAAQFSPFAALTGYDGVIQETARLTDREIELADGGRQILEEQLQKLRACLDRQPRVVLTCFQPDARKQGGAYVTVTGHLKKIDPHSRCLVLLEGEMVPLERIYRIEGETGDLSEHGTDGMI